MQYIVRFNFFIWFPETIPFFLHVWFFSPQFIYLHVFHFLPGKAWLFFFFFLSFPQWSPPHPPTTPFPLFSHVNITCHSHLYLKSRVKFWGISWWKAVSRVFQILLPCGPPVWSDTGERVLQGFFSCLNGLWLERRLVEKHSACRT